MADDSGVWVKVFPDYVGGATGAAVIDSAVADDPDNYPVKTSSFTGDGTNGDKDQNYDVYEFLGSGTLNVTTPGMVDVLVVAGGGGGGTGTNNGWWGGGGGAGGYFYLTDEMLNASPYTITIGAGGAAANTLGTNATSGDASGIGSGLVAIGGGEGATNSNKGGRGGSGGGGGQNSGTNSVGGTSQYPQQGNSGGASTPAIAGGGGGGAAEAGNTDGSGHGGDGIANFITGASVLWGGGGAGHGGAAGDGGGGAVGAAGEANTGGGGGANIYAGLPGNGGSGIVIIRVKVDTKSFGLRTQSTTPKTAHAARVENGVVRQVITIPHLNDDDNKITEYCNKIGLPGTWVDTSYTGARRGKYAGVGDLFDLNARNAEFVSPVTEEAS